MTELSIDTVSPKYKIKLGSRETKGSIEKLTIFSLIVLLFYLILLNVLLMVVVDNLIFK